MKEPRITISREMLRLIAEIDEFKGQWKALGSLAPGRLEVLKKVATIESIGSSTRIEGAKLSDREVELLLKGLHTKSFRTRDEQEVAGYAEVMNIIFDSYPELPLTENYIKQLHSILLKFSHKDTRHRGEYKKLPNHVEAFDNTGKSLGIVFETATPYDTPMKMASLIQWLNKALEEDSLHPLLTVAVFVVVFLSIHPFQDGNGRLSRILTTLLLLKTGYLHVPYSSLESVIELNKANYYLALRKTQGTLDKKKENYEPWAMFFLKSLKAQKDNLAKKIEREHSRLKLPALSIQIIEIVKEHGQATISDIQAITKANRNTIKLKLKELVAGNYLVQQGKGKGTRYTLGNLSA